MINRRVFLILAIIIMLLLTVNIFLLTTRVNKKIDVIKPIDPGAESIPEGTFRSVETGIDITHPPDDFFLDFMDE